MDQQKSFTKIEQNVRHIFRKNLNIAATDEEVKKSFVQAAQEFIEQALEGRVVVNYGDVVLDDQAENGFFCSSALMKNREFLQNWEHSDMAKILSRFAESAFHRIKHLEEKQPEKTEAKLFPTPSHAGQHFRNLPVKKGG